MKNDLISRQAAIDALDKRFDSIPMNQTTEILLLRKDLRELPPAQPDRKRGKWIDYVNSHCECSVCHTEWSYFQNETECFEFCPNCGADMRDDDEKQI